MPLEVVSQVDVARMAREVKALDNFFTQNKAYNEGPGQTLKLSVSLAKVATDNNYNLRHASDCQKLAAQLDQIIGKAPLLHISFASEPSPATLEKILSWLRANIHPLTLLQVGLQPTIAAGCVLRTPNKIFDMSMRNHLKREEPFLMKLISIAAKRQTP